MFRRLRQMPQFISLLCGTETQSIYMLSVMPHSSRFWSMLSARDCWWHKEHAPLNLIHFLIKRPTFQHWNSTIPVVVTREPVYSKEKQAKDTTCHIQILNRSFCSFSSSRFPPITPKFCKIKTLWRGEQKLHFCPSSSSTVDFEASQSQLIC